MKTLYTAFGVAKYFLFKADRDRELLSNLKIQKMVYYAQGLHLAMYDTPIFKNKIRAWNYGPVIPELYSKYKKYGSGGIPADELFDTKSINKAMREFLDEIYDAFGQFSARRLADLTHTEQCWQDAHPNGIISHKSMRESLKKYLKDG